MLFYVATPLLTKMVESMTKDNSIHENIVLGLACMSGCYTIWMLANKAPQLVSGLLNGSPSMSRGDLLTPARQVSNTTSTAVNTGASIAGTISAANNSEGGYNDLRAQGKGRLASMVGTLGNLKDYAVAQMPGREAWSSAQSNYRDIRNRDKENAFIRKMGNKVERDADGNMVIDEKTSKPRPWHGSRNPDLRRTILLDKKLLREKLGRGRKCMILPSSLPRMP